MKRRKIWFFGSLIVTLFVIFILTTGSPLLTMAMDKNDTIPLGNLIVWAGMIALPFTIYFGVKELRNPTRKLTKILAGFLKIIIILALLWVPISYLLAGNFSFNFSESESFQGGQIAMQCFWFLSYGIALGTIFTIINYWISLLFKKDKTHN